ncbi:hypothetical protein TNCV_3208681 [Trichonephila clavipes]|nr:hypothetical protein TNCV_3208681 [Trichonephila clavipes]
MTRKTREVAKRNAIGQWRISQHGSSLLQLTSPAHRICLNASNNPSSIGVGCAMTYAAATSNNSCDNPLWLHFRCQAVMHSSSCKHSKAPLNHHVPDRLSDNPLEIISKGNPSTAQNELRGVAELG